MSNTQLKIRIRLDQAADHPAIEQDSPEYLEEKSLLPTSHSVYVYNWPRIIGALLLLLLVFMVFLWAISDSSDQEPEINPTNTVSSTTPSTPTDISPVVPIQPTPSADESLSDQSPRNNPNEPDKLSDRHTESEYTKDISSSIPDSISLMVSASPIKPGMKPEIAAAFQPQQDKAIQKLNRSIGLIKAQLTSNIRQRAPIDDIDRISLAGKPSRSIFLFLHFNKFRNKKIFVSWYYRDKRVAKIALPIGSGDWRTHSSKILEQNRLGSWHVTVTNQSGKLLARFNFSVTH